MPCLALMLGLIQLGLTKAEALAEARKLLPRYYPDEAIGLNPDAAILYFRLQGARDRRAATDDISDLLDRGHSLGDALAESFKLNRELYAERPWVRA